MQQMLNAALLIAAVSHDGQFDKAGKPYLLHVLRVMNSLNSTDEELNCIAVLHDVLEDTNTSVEHLRDVGMSERVIVAAQLLNKNGKTQEEYQAGILSNEDAMLVKKADLEDNMDLRRLKGVTEKDMARVNKYVLMYHTIDQRLKELHNDAASVPVVVDGPTKDDVTAEIQKRFGWNAKIDIPDNADEPIMVFLPVKEVPASEFDRWMSEPAEPVAPEPEEKTYPKSIKDLIKHRFGTVAPEPKIIKPGVEVRLKGNTIRDRWGRVIEVSTNTFNRVYTLGEKNGLAGDDWAGYDVVNGGPLIWVRSDDVVPV